MLNLKNNENDAVFEKICKIKIKFQKMKDTFLDSIPSMVEKPPTATDTYISIFLFPSSRRQPR